MSLASVARQGSKSEGFSVNVSKVTTVDEPPYEGGFRGSANLVQDNISN